MSQFDTKERILNAAERLFAREGYQGTSLRTITGEAGVNLAAVNYHFGSKESLIQEVFARRLAPLNAIRMERLEQLRRRAADEKTRPDLRQALRAFVEPTLTFREKVPGGEDFVTLVGRVMAEPEDTIRMMFLEQIRPVFELLFRTLCEALPATDRNLLFWRLHFAVGAMSHTLCWMGRFPALPEGLSPPNDVATILELLLDFITAGMEEGR